MTLTGLQNQRKSREFMLRGTQALRNGRLDDARLAFELAVDADADCVEAYLALSRLRFPGDTYLDLLTKIHRAFSPSTYVEIGVGTGSSLQRTLPSTLCVGIDPAPHQASGLPPHVRTIPLTSGTFFARDDVTSILGFSKIDLAFVDGMHLFEYALDDFVNLEQYMARDGIILVHDCIPFDRVTSARQRNTRFWTGDVWRLLPTLRHFRPELDITVIECAPSGLAVIRNLVPDWRLGGEQRAAFLKYGQSLELAHALRESGVYTLPNDWAKLAPLFSRRVA